MTAETLKPFITPMSGVGNFPASQSSVAASRSSLGKSKLLAIAFATVAFSLSAVLLGLTLWSSTRVTKLETDLADLNKVVKSLHDRLGIHYLDELKEFEKEKKLDNDLADLRKVVESLQQRLGTQYLDELNKFQKDYGNALIDDPRTLDDADIKDDDQDDIDDEDDDDLDDYDDGEENGADGNEEYSDLKRKYEDLSDVTDYVPDDVDEDGDSASYASEGVDFFNDFEKYQDSKKKKQRKLRSIAEVRNEVQTYDELTQSQNKTKQNETTVAQVTPQPASGSSNNGLEHRSRSSRRHFVADPHEQRRISPLRMRSSRRRRLPTMKSGESFISAKAATLTSGGLSAIPAAHFHLNERINHRNAPISMDASLGDLYIGHASASSNNNDDNAWQQYFSLDRGVLTVHEPGLYYVYAQVCYNNTHDQNGFVIFHGHKPFLQCLNTVPTNLLKIHTCHTSGLINLQENETIHIRDFHRDRNVVLKHANNRSYFGLIKI